MACRRSVPEACRWVLLLAVLCLATTTASAEFGSAKHRLGSLPGVVRLAASVNGQAVRCLDGDRGALVSFEGDRLATVRDVVGPLADFRCSALGCLPGDLVVAVGQTEGAWELRSYRIEPGTTADPGSPLQKIPLGDAAEPALRIDVVVSSNRGWLAVVGLPPPLSPVLRAAVAGVRIGPLSDRSCPDFPPGSRPMAATVSPRDELVIVTSPEPRTAEESQGDAVAFYDLTGRERARFATGVTAVQGISFDRQGETLCVAGRGIGDGSVGVWRLEATLVAGRQAIRPTLVALVAAPQDLVSVAERRFMMLSSDPAGTLLQVDPSSPSQSPSTLSRDAPP
jgi:hypothetical protein